MCCFLKKFSREIFYENQEDNIEFSRLDGASGQALLILKIHDIVICEWSHLEL